MRVQIQWPIHYISMCFQSGLKRWVIPCLHFALPKYCSASGVPADAVEKLIFNFSSGAPAVKHDPKPHSEEQHKHEIGETVCPGDFITTIARESHLSIDGNAASNEVVKMTVAWVDTKKKLWPVNRDTTTHIRTQDTHFWRLWSWSTSPGIHWQWHRIDVRQWFQLLWENHHLQWSLCSRIKSVWTQHGAWRFACKLNNAF